MKLFRKLIPDNKMSTLKFLNKYIVLMNLKMYLYFLAFGMLKYINIIYSFLIKWINLVLSNPFWSVLLALGPLDLTLGLAACLQIDLMRLRGTRDTCQTGQEKEGKCWNQLCTCVYLCVFAEKHLVSNQRSRGNRLYPHSILLVLCLGSKNLFPLPLQLNYFI